ncbi:MAG: ATP-binding cassette domain-containing protein, partial [Actinomycetota bacterium]
MSIARTAIEVDGLRVTAKRTGRTILHGVDIVIPAGSVTGIVGESGSGKTTLLRCLIGAAANGLTTAGSVELVDDDARVDLLGASPRVLRSIRSQRIAYLAQDPGRSLTPTMRIGAAIAERLPGDLGSARRDRAVRALLESVGLPDDDDFIRRHPFALSGGQAQRVGLARALATSPDVLLLDEPTTGLDVITQADVIDELRRLHERSPRTTVIVSHDLAVVAQLADHVIVLRDGRIVEQGPATATLRTPADSYTQQLVDACPDPRRGTRTDRIATVEQPSIEDSPDQPFALRVSGLVATHHRPRRAPVVAAQDVDLELRAGCCVALVGSSGSGKSTIARTIVGAHVPDAGEIVLRGRRLGASLSDRSDEDRWRLQLIPQDPTSSLDPRRRVGRAVADVLRRCRPGGLPHDRSAVDEQVIDLFERVGLDPALRHRRPGALSGGERQRVVIARGLAANPHVLICD